MTKVRIDYENGNSIDFDTSKMRQYEFRPVNNTGTHGTAIHLPEIGAFRKTVNEEPIEYLLKCVLNRRPLILASEDGEGFGRLVSLDHVREIKSLETKTQ